MRIEKDFESFYDDEVQRNSFMPVLQHVVFEKDWFLIYGSGGSVSIHRKQWAEFCQLIEFINQRGNL